jgi:hypothetical protein
MKLWELPVATPSTYSFPSDFYGHISQMILTVRILIPIRAAREPVPIGPKGKIQKA